MTHEQASDIIAKVVSGRLTTLKSERQSHLNKAAEIYKEIGEIEFALVNFFTGGLKSDTVKAELEEEIDKLSKLQEPEREAAEAPIRFQTTSTPTAVEKPKIADEDTKEEDKAEPVPFPGKPVTR